MYKAIDLFTSEQENTKKSPVGVNSRIDMHLNRAVHRIRPQIDFVMLYTDPEKSKSLRLVSQANK